MNGVSALGAPLIDQLLIDHLQVLLQSRLIIACYKCISKLARSPRPNASLSSLNLALHLLLQTRSITASQCNSGFTPPCPPSVSRNFLDDGFPAHPWVHSISISKCMSKLVRSRPWSVSLYSLDRDFQAHLELLSSTAFSQYRYTVCRCVALFGPDCLSLG